MLFEIVNGRARPRLSTNPDNTPRIADGVRFFTLEQAAASTCTDAGELAAAWEDHVGDYQVQGADLFAAEPADPVTSAARTRLSLLHRTVYPHLSDEHFEAFVAFCEERKFSPWCRHVWPELRPGADGLPRLTFITTIEALRLIAIRTGQCQGPVRTQFAGDDGELKDLWLSDKPPAIAVAGVRRAGFTDVVYATARWVSYAPKIKGPGGSEIIDPFWQQFDDHQLGKCAEALSLRKAFPQEMSGLYIREEMMQAGPPPTPSGEFGKKISQTGDVPDAQPTDETPDNEGRFRLEVIDVVGSRHADNVIGHFRAMLGNRHADRRQFYATVLAELRRDPEKYSGSLVAA